MAGWFWQYGIWLTGFSGCLLVALVLIAWGLWGDRCRGRLRCPKCWYDMRGREGETKLTCPECGKAVGHERHLQRNRKRLWAIALGAVLLLPPVYAGYVYQGWAREQDAIKAINEAHDIARIEHQRLFSFTHTAVAWDYTGPQWQWWVDLIPPHIGKYYDRAFYLSLHADIGDAVEHVGDLKHLRSVSLYASSGTVFQPDDETSEPGNCWPSRVIQTLPSLSSLEYLQIEGARLTNADIRRVAQAHRLRTVVLAAPRERYVLQAGERVKDPLFDPVAYDGHAFADWTRLVALERVVMRNTCVDDHVLTPLAALPRLNTLELIYPNLTPAGLATIGRMQHLTTLRLDRAPLRDEDLIPIGKRAGLQELYLNQAPITDAGIAHLAPLTNLTHLWLNDIPITEAGLSHLSGMTQMQALAIPDAQIEGHALKHLAGMSRLEEIKLSGSTVDDTAGPYFANWPRMKVLHLEKAERLTDAMVPHLLGLPNIEHLYVQATGLTESGKQQLRAAFPGATIP